MNQRRLKEEEEDEENGGKIRGIKGIRSRQSRNGKRRRGSKDQWYKKNWLIFFHSPFFSLFTTVHWYSDLGESDEDNTSLMFPVSHFSLSSTPRSITAPLSHTSYHTPPPSLPSHSNRHFHRISNIPLHPTPSTSAFLYKINNQQKNLQTKEGKK